MLHGHRGRSTQRILDARNLEVIQGLPSDGGHGLRGFLVRQAQTGSAGRRVAFVAHGWTVNRFTTRFDLGSRQRQVFGGVNEGRSAASASKQQTGRKVMFQNEDSYDEWVKRVNISRMLIGI